MKLSDKDIEELFMVLSFVKVDLTEAIRNAPDEASRTKLKDHRAIILQWIHRLLQGTSDQAHED